jgi:hypothetical protein
VKRITDIDFFIGIFIAMCFLEYKEVLSPYDKKFQRALIEVFQNLFYHARERDLDIRFWIPRYWYCKGSTLIEDDILRLVKMGVVYFYGSEKRQIKMGLSKEVAKKRLEDIPGGEGLFIELAAELINKLENPQPNQGELLQLKYPGNSPWGALLINPVSSN